jgi:hypothetical protein
MEHHLKATGVYVRIILKRILKKYGKCRTYSSASGYRAVVGSCEHGNGGSLTT